CQDGYGFLVSF
nr:immunoglobulin light chain junction region [Macaca mulatta]MOW10125.1 immunoglobulin light chain junction region [Macaca mulatta]